MSIHFTIPKVGRLTGLLAAGLLAGCGGDSSNSGGGEPSQAARVQDTRTFTASETQAADFDADGGVAHHEDAQQWSGIRPNGASYRIEVPDAWNGRLVMYAHGYRGEGSDLTVGNPSIRQWLLDNGYAWAASSYSTNFYDVRTGVEDTNELALAFTDITGLAAPDRRYITGHSMGGHVTAAAIEDETLATANNPVQYDGAVPMCGVVGDTFEFEYLTQVTMAAQHFAHMKDANAPPLTGIPATNFDANAINAVIWTVPPIPPSQSNPSGSLGIPTSEGEQFQALMRNLSGGERPVADIGFTTYYWHVVMGTGGRDGTVNGILARDLTGNAGVNYQFDNFPPLSTEEQAFNDTIVRVEGNPSANGLRNDGLRWIPVINGEFNIPVVSLQGLGDFYVPFRHGQIYRERAEANGNDIWLVQRAIRSPGHCDYTPQEQIDAFEDMVAWEQGGPKPPGDDFLNPATVAADSFGCAFSTADRAGLPACTPP